MTTDPSFRLAPDDEALPLIYRQAEDVLQFLSASEEDSATAPEPWTLPVTFTGGVALQALYRVREALRGTLDEAQPRVVDEEVARPRGPRLFGPDGSYEHAPVRLVPIDQSDLDVLAAAVATADAALSRETREAEGNPWARQRLHDLFALLSDIEPDPSLWPRDEEPKTAAANIRPLSRLVSVLDLSVDDDTRLIVEVLTINRRDGGDVVLTASEEAALVRLGQRFNELLTDADPLNQFRYTGHIPGDPSSSRPSSASNPPQPPEVKT